MKPAGLENSIGVIVGTINKDPTDSKWSGDEGVQAYKAFFAKYLPGADFENTSYLTGYMQGMIHPYYSLSIAPAVAARYALNPNPVRCQPGKTLLSSALISACAAVMK